MFFNGNKKKLTTRQFDEEVKRLEEIVKSSVSPFENDTPAKQKARVKRAREDQDFFNQTYLPHYFTQPGAEFHVEMEEMIGEGLRQRRPVAVAAPRGHSKTTRVTFAHTLKEALYEQNKFTIIISDTEQQARGMTVSIRVEAEHNPRIAHDFGPQKTSQWAAGDFVLQSGTRVLARGDGQGIRGLKHGPHRPDRIKVDDIESDESVRNPERVKQTLAWIMEAVVPSLDPMTGVLFVVGTLLSKKSVLAQCLANPVFISKIYKAVADAVWSEEQRRFTAGTPLWPERFTLEQLSRTRDLIKSIAFNKEYQNEPTDDDAKFKLEWFRRVPWELVPPCQYFQGIDPSLGQGESGDFNPNITLGLAADGHLYVRYADIKRRSVDSLIKTAYLLQSRFRALMVALETNGFQKILKREFDRAAKKERRYLPIVEIEHYGAAKELRVQRLSPLVEQGVMQFAAGPETEVGDMETLIEQLQFFPTPSVHDDGPDALEMAAYLAEGMAGTQIAFHAAGERRVTMGREMHRYTGEGSAAHY